MLPKIPNLQVTKLDMCSHGGKGETLRSSKPKHWGDHPGPTLIGPPLVGFLQRPNSVAFHLRSPILQIRKLRVQGSPRS